MVQVVEAPAQRAPRRRRGRLLVGVAVALIVLGGAVLVIDRTPARSAPNGALDVPAEGALVETPLELSGWALDAGSADQSGIERVDVYVDGTLLASATYGLARPDIGAAFGERFAASGFAAQLDPRALAPGEHQLEARARSALSGQDAAYTRTIRVEHASAPRGALDVPADGETIRGTVEVRGWALDEAAEDGPGVDHVQLYVDGDPVAEATYGQTRPELAEAYSARFGRAGWVAEIDTSALSAGEHTLEARAHSTASGAETAYTRRVVIAPH